MADSKISDLTDGTAPQDTDAFAIARSGSTLKLLWSALKAAVYAPGGTDVAVADGGTGASTAANARTNLGLGTLATQSGTFSGTSSGTNTGDQTTVSGNAGTATALATGRTIDGQTFDGTANITVIAPGSHAATSKATPVDADELPLVDSAASNVLKKLTWANLKATLKAYTDTLYPSGSGTSSGTNTGDQTISDATISTTDITTNNVSTSKHGFAPKAPNDATKFLDGTGAYSVPTGADKLGLTPTAVKTSAYGAAAGDFVPVDTTSGAVTVTLPTAPADKSVVAIKHVIQGGTNTVTYATGGSDVLNKASGATSGTLTLLAQSVVLQYKSSSAIWYIVAGDAPVAQLDLRYQGIAAAAGGDLTGTYPNPTLANAGGGAAGPTGSITAIPVVTVDAKGRVTALTSVTPKTVATDVIWDTKGDLAAATGADTAAKLVVGTDFLDSLIPDSSVSTGLRWAIPRSPLRPSGSLYETFSREQGSIQGAASLVSQRLSMFAIKLPNALLITSITFMSAGTALSGGTNQLFGLYDSSRALLRSSTDDGATGWSASVVKTLNLTSTFTTTYSGLYYLGISINASTVPTLQTLIAGTSAMFGVAPIICGTSSTGVTTALPNPAAAITAASPYAWAWVS